MAEFKQDDFLTGLAYYALSEEMDEPLEPGQITLPRSPQSLAYQLGDWLAQQPELGVVVRDIKLAYVDAGGRRSAFFNNLGGQTAVLALNHINVRLTGDVRVPAIPLPAGGLLITRAPLIFATSQDPNQTARVLYIH